MPLFSSSDDGYHLLLNKTFKKDLQISNIDNKHPKYQLLKQYGKLAVLYDKNMKQAIAYAKIIANMMNENVYLVQYNEEPNNYVKNSQCIPVKFENKIVYITL